MMCQNKCPQCQFDRGSIESGLCPICKERRADNNSMKISAQLKHWPEDKPDVGDLCIVYTKDEPDMPAILVLAVYYHGRWQTVLMRRSYDCRTYPDFIAVKDLKAEE